MYLFVDRAYFLAASGVILMSIFILGCGCGALNHGNVGSQLQLPTYHSSIFVSRTHTSDPHVPHQSSQISHKHVPNRSDPTSRVNREPGVQWRSQEAEGEEPSAS